jgi:NAD(P)-dependent dehydrogenase (short-subunit alcohol dehydrogenase family)
MDKLQANAAALCKEGCVAEALLLDVTKSESIDELCSRVGEVDILINVSGTNLRKPFEKYTVEEYERMMNTNVHGFVFLTQKIGARMVERGKGGKIIFIGSLMSVLGMPYLTIYAMTKAALAGLTRTLAAEWGKDGIQVNCIAPGFIVTDMNREMWQAENMKGWLKGVQAIPRNGTTDDVAHLATFLSGKGSNYITGQVIPVDGGYTATAVWPYQPPK